MPIFVEIFDMRTLLKYAKNAAISENAAVACNSHKTGMLSLCVEVRR